jgi:hypothetical protein
MFLYLQRQFLPAHIWTKKETSALCRQLSAGNLPFKISNFYSETEGDEDSNWIQIIIKNSGSSYSVQEITAHV